MIRHVIGVLVGVGVVGRAHADPAPDPAPTPIPDPRAEELAREANLVTNAPRAGLTFSGTLGGGLVLGDGVGRGPSLSLRVGHVATSSTVVTLELEIGTLIHQPMGGPLLHNDLANLMAGGLTYINPSFWVRGAGGLTVYTARQPGVSDSPHPGMGALIGFGLDLARWHYLVLGIETFTTASMVATRGVVVNGSVGIGLTYY